MFLWNPNVTYLIVDGIIGAGKTELSRGLSKATGWRILEEPAELSITPYISDFYKVLSGEKQNEGEAILMQLDMLHRRYRAHKTVGLINQSVIQDRSIWGDKIFAEINHENGLISSRDYQFYLDMFQSFSTELVMPSIILFLDVLPDVAMSRIQSRGRMFEKNVTLEYLETLDRKYREWLDWMRQYTVVYEYSYNDQPLNDKTIQEVVGIINDLKTQDNAKRFLKRG